MVLGKATIDATIAELNEVIDSAALEPARWAEFIDLLRQRTNDSKIILQVYDPEFSWCEPVNSSGFGNATLRSYSEYFASISPWRNVLLNLKPGATVWTDAHVPIQELHQTEFYNDMLRPEGDSDSATGLNVINDSHRKAALAVHFSSRNAEAMNAVVAPILQGVAGRIWQSLNVNRVFAESGDRFTGDTSLLRALTIPAFIANRTGQVLAANDALLGLVERHDAVSIGKGDLLHFSPIDFQRRFLEELNSLEQDTLNVLTARNTDITLRHVAMPLVVSILPIANGSRDVRGIDAVFSSRKHFLVMIRCQAPSNPDQTAREQLAGRFKLTPAEIGLVLALERGESLTDYSRSLDLSLHTVRSQLRSIFSKTDTHKQHEVVALLARLRR